MGVEKSIKIAAEKMHKGLFYKGFTKKIQKTLQNTHLMHGSVFTMGEKGGNPGFPDRSKKGGKHYGNLSQMQRRTFFAGQRRMAVRIVRG